MKLLKPSVLQLLRTCLKRAVVTGFLVTLMSIGPQASAVESADTVPATGKLETARKRLDQYSQVEPWYALLGVGPSTNGVGRNTTLIGLYLPINYQGTLFGLKGRVFRQAKNGNDIGGDRIFRNREYDIGASLIHFPGHTTGFGHYFSGGAGFAVQEKQGRRDLHHSEGGMVDIGLGYSLPVWRGNRIFFEAGAASSWVDEIFFHNALVHVGVLL